MINNFWDIKAKIYKYRSKSLFGKILDSENQMIKKMISKYDFNKKLIVDLGAGLGNAANLIETDFSCHIFALDYSYTMLKKNRNSNKQNIPIVSTANKIPLKTNSADFIFIVGLMEYIHDKNSTLKEISRVLKPNALAVITFSPNNIFTYGRLFWGNSLYPTREEENIKILTSKFQIIKSSKTFMQRQYLIKKP